MTSLLIILQFALIAMLVKLMRRPAVSPLLSTSLFMCAILWYIAPVSIRLLWGSHLPILHLVSDDTYARYGVIETALLLVTILALFLSRPYFSVIRNCSLASVAVGPSRAWFIVIVGIGISAVLSTRGSSFGATYLERNAFAVTGVGTSQYDNMGSISFLQTLLISFGYACLLIPWRRSMVTRLLYVALFLWNALTIIPYVLLGGRIALLVPFALITLRGRALQWPKKKMFLRVSTAFALTVVLGGAIAAALGSSRMQSDLAPQDIVSLSIDKMRTESSGTNLTQLALTGVVYKFDSISWGASLVGTFGTHFAGLRAYEGVLLALIPRQVLTSKPIPGSADGTYQGQATRILFSSTPGTGNNVQVSPAAITIWQLGYWGLILLVIINVIDLYVINSLLLSTSLVLQSLGLFLIGIPAFYTLVASPDVVLVSLQRVMLIAGALSVGAGMTRRRHS
jgi:hypothetical protein